VRYRVAVRYVDGQERYHIEDIDASSMEQAMRAVLDRVDATVLGAATLVEIRPQPDEGERRYSAG